MGEKGKFWPVGHNLKIAFIGGTTEQRRYVEEKASEWLKYANLFFQWDMPVSGSDIRISFNEGNGSWSYIGTDSLGIPVRRATMNFGWLDNAVVLHEFGHALGLGHEHQNPEGGILWDQDAVIKELSGPPNNWDISTIVFNVLEAYNQDKIVGTKLDPHSIMMYSIPKEWTVNGFETSFNQNLSDLDKLFISSLYPFEEEKTDKVSEALKTIFLSRKDILRLNEATICRIGDVIGAGTNEQRYWKRQNAEKVWDKLNA